MTLGVQKTIQKTSTGKWRRRRSHSSSVCLLAGGDAKTAADTGPITVPEDFVIDKARADFCLTVGSVGGQS